MNAQELAAEWAADHPEAADVLRAEGAAAENKRVNDVRAMLVPGHEAMIEQLAADGQTTGDAAARAIVLAEQALRADHASLRAAEGIPPLPEAPAPEGLESKPPAPPAALDPRQLASRAREIEAAAHAKGQIISIPAAVAKARQELISASEVSQ